MTSSRLDSLRAMVARAPSDPRFRFGLALEYLTSGERHLGIEELRRYLEIADDEGNAWGRLAEALLEGGEVEEAREAWIRGIEAAERFGHPTMADEFRERLGEIE